MSALDLSFETERDFDPAAELSTEVLADRLGDFFSREDEEREVAAWETVNGRPLKRSFESWTDYRKRKEKFKPARPPKPYLVDRQTAAEDYRRLMKVEQPTPAQQHLIHELEDVLEREHTDFSKPRPRAEDAEKASMTRFTLIEQEDLWVERLKKVVKETDAGALTLVAMRDSHEDVRAAAHKRILEISIR